MAKRPIAVTGRSSRLTPVRSPGTSQAEALADKRFSNQLFSIGQTGQGMLDEIEVEEATLAGTIAGRDINGFKPRRDKTLTARAFNKAGLRSFQSEISINASREAANIFDQHRNDPAKLKDALNGYRVGIEGQLEQQFPEAVQDFRDSYERQSSAYMRQSSDEHLRVQESQAAAKSSEFLDTLQEGAENIAFTAVSDVDATAGIAAERKRLVEEMANYGPKQAFEIEGIQVEEDIDRMVVYSPEQMAKGLAAFDSQMLEKRILGKFERAANKESFLAKFNEKLGKHDRVQGLTIDQTNAVAAKMRVGVNAEKSERSAADKVLKGQVKDAVTLLGKGHSPDGLADLRLAVAGTSLEPILSGAVVLADYNGQIRQGNQASITGELEWFEDNPPTTMFEAARFEATVQAKKDMDAGLKGDWITWADESGKFDLEPLDFTKPEAWAARVDTINKMEGYYGQMGPALSDTEANQLSNAWAQADGVAKMGMAQSFVESLQGEMATETLAQLDKKHATSFAFMGELLQDGDANTAMLLSNGMDQITNDPKIIPTGQGNDLEMTLRDLTGNAYGSVAHQAVVEDAARNIYAGLSAANGDRSGTLNQGRAETAIDLASGGIIDYTLTEAKNFQGFDVPGFDIDPRRTVAPAPGVTGDEFTAWVNTIDVNDVNRWGGVVGFKPGHVVDMIRTGSWRLVSRGAGKYKVMAETLGDGTFGREYGAVQSRGGGNFTIDWFDTGEKFDPLDDDEISLLPVTEGPA